MSIKLPKRLSSKRKSNFFSFLTLHLHILGFMLCKYLMNVKMLQNKSEYCTVVSYKAKVLLHENIFFCSSTVA